MGNSRLILAILVFLLSVSTAYGQTEFIHHHKNLVKLKSDKDLDIRVLYSDSLQSTFYISIKKEVAAHFHASHCETVYVLSGKGMMMLNDSVFKINKGSLIFIPQNTPHSVRVLGKKPLKVMSIQSPHFDGTDRIWIKP
ncbi:MAG TPA: cupin domain-containing protein [Bacteroidia bacterium]|nr:cupin domain-containing protein [Bacteroidia bacterium]